MTINERKQIESVIAIDLMGMDYGLKVLKCDLNAWPVMVIVHDYTILTVGLGYSKDSAIRCIRAVAERINIELPHGIID